MPKIIFHIDIDSFFVSAHRAINNSLINKPIVVARNHRNAIAVAVSYEAREKGLKVAMPLFMMQNFIKDIIVITPQYDLYSYLSTIFFEYITKTWTNKIEINSVDECYLDVTELIASQNFLVLAKSIQTKILEKFKLPITIGIGPNKFLAKMATNRGKPFGIFELNKKNFRNILYPLDIKNFFAIGKSSVNKLKTLGIKTIGDFATLSYDDQNLQKIFGKKLLEHWNNIQGLGSDLLNLEHNDLKQIGNSLTFEDHKLSDRNDIILILKELCFKVATRMKNRNTLSQLLSVQIKKDFKIWKSHQIKLDNPIQEFSIIYKIALKTFDDFWDEAPIKGIGISCGKLIDEFKEGSQINLFDFKQIKQTKVETIIQKVNYQMQKKEIYSLAELEKNLKKKQMQSRFLIEDSIWKK